MFSRYELHLSNDGFGYKDMYDPNFKKTPLEPPMDRADSTAWVGLPVNYVVQLQAELKAIATTFKFSTQTPPDLYYNSDVLRMEFHFSEPNRYLIVMLEPGFPEFNPRQQSQRLTYDQIRDLNIQDPGFE